MRGRGRHWISTGAALGALALLPACGGGSAVSSTPPPLAAIVPAPTPTSSTPATLSPTAISSPAGFARQPVPAAFDTDEFRNSGGAGQHNAVSAWTAGHTGAGVTIGIIDTGIDPDSPEFAGRLSPASADIYGTRSLEGPDDHGTLVAMVAAAARDDTGILGIAWDATVLSIRADAPGSCGSAGDCMFDDDAIADALDLAVASGAKVVNISLGGPDGANARLTGAVSDAAAAGVLLVIAAGNDGFSGLDNFATGMAAAGNGNVLVVGSVDANYTISDFSNRAGGDAQFYLAARGEDICCTYRDGEVFVDSEGFIYLFSGTSFAAPQVAGAAALLAQTFPNLSGSDIAEILLASAFDAGESGLDAVYGAGILDIARAFQPLGGTAIAGQAAALPLGEIGAVASPAMGDALTTASLPALVTDRYDRAFSADLGARFSGAAANQPLHGAIGRAQRQLGGGSEALNFAFTIEDDGAARALRLTTGDAEQARVLAASAAMRIAPDTQIALGFAQGAAGLTARLQRQAGPVFMLSGSRDAGAQADAAIALRQQFGRWGLTVSAESGQDRLGAAEQRAAELRGQSIAGDVASLGLAFDRRFGALDTALGLQWQTEERKLLGARFHDGFGLAGAESLFASVDLGWQLGVNWRLGGNFRQGFTRARAAALVADGSQLSSNSWALDLERRGVFASGDALALRLSQPLRVASGGLNLNLPVSWDYSTLTAGYGLHHLSLAPEGREVMGELAWRGEWLGGDAAMSLFYRHDPGHIAGAAGDAGLGLRWGRRF